MAQNEEAAEEKRKKDDPMSSLPDDSKFGIQRLLEMARDDPLHYMDEATKGRVQTARGDLRCDVCRKVLEETVSEVLPKPKSLRSEHDLLTIMEKICEGGPDLSIPNYFGVEPPPLPAKWTDRWRPKLDKKLNRYVLKAMPKKSRQKRDKWRSLANEGKQQPPDPDDAEQDADSVAAATKLASMASKAEDTMLTLTCKDITHCLSFVQTQSYTSLTVNERMEMARISWSQSASPSCCFGKWGHARPYAANAAIRKLNLACVRLAGVLLCGGCLS